MYGNTETFLASSCLTRQSATRGHGTLVQLPNNRHAGEFSALRCEDHKSWLRLHVSRTGDLRIHALGIDVVPRRWKEATPTTDAPSLLVPDDARATAPRLVDYIEVRGGR